MNLICVLIKDQIDNIDLIIKSIKSQTHPIDTWFVLDRTACDKKDQDGFKFIHAEHLNYVGRPSMQMFLAGSTRNYALSRAFREGYSNVIFIDGDCIPESNLVHSHLRILNKKRPIITFGKRLESKYGNKDQRETSPKKCVKAVFENKSGTVFSDFNLIKKSTYLWSCNFGINKMAYEYICHFNDYYYGRYEVFNSDFSGTYGFEDTFLAVTAHHCNVFLCSSNDLNSGVYHIDHPRPNKIYDISHYAPFFEEKVSIQEMLMIERPFFL